MNTIGLIGGTSWPSTIEYYKLLNELIQEKSGGYHSARILLKSIDYHEIKSHYHDGWTKIPALLKKEIMDFVPCAPDCLILCNNTLHKAYDIIAAECALNIPFFHCVELTAAHALQMNYQRVLLLGTKFTMEDGFFTRILEQHGLLVDIPQLEDRMLIQDIQSQLAKGIREIKFEQYFTKLLQKYTHVDAVVLACTELPLAIRQETSVLPVINPSVLQCIAAVDYVLG